MDGGMDGEREGGRESLLGNNASITTGVTLKAEMHISEMMSPCSDAFA